MLIFAIESSCDETSCSIVEDGKKEISTVVASSAEFHEKTGGVVPEVAARKQVEFLVPVIDQTLKDGVEKLSISVEELINKIDSIAVTVGPGLSGSLMVGIEGAKALSLAWNKPLICVNHLVGHIYANFIDHKPEFPCLALVISGGHTDLIFMKDHGDIEYIGGTIDDAAGEAFDKGARIMGISNYLGGVLLSKKASEFSGKPQRMFPRPLIGEDNFDFSFSGLKTALKRKWDSISVGRDENINVSEIAFEYEEAIVDVVSKKTAKAALKLNPKSILLCGGVAANLKLRKGIEEELNKNDVNANLYFPQIRLCTDNAAYIASCAFFNRNSYKFEDIYPIPSLGVADKL